MTPCCRPEEIEPFDIKFSAKVFQSVELVSRNQFRGCHRFKDTCDGPSVSTLVENDLDGLRRWPRLDCRRGPRGLPPLTLSASLTRTGWCRRPMLRARPVREGALGSCHRDRSPCARRASCPRPTNCPYINPGAFNPPRDPRTQEKSVHFRTRYGDRWAVLLLEQAPGCLKPQFD
jgi:hypothetical protein